MRRKSESANLSIFPDDDPVMIKMTPMQRQYAAVKEQYPDVLVMFRMGDFYEMFGPDAEIAAPILEIVLTKRENNPLCGVPYHAVERYVAKLLAAGHRVAVCDQVEDPKKAKGLVRREVTRVVSAGTVLEDSFLPQTSNNYLAAISPGDKTCGIAVADISTGEFLVTQFDGDSSLGDALSEIERLNPAECIIAPVDVDLEQPLRSAGARSVTAIEAEPVFAIPPREVLLKHFGVLNLRGFGCEDQMFAQSAAALVVRYLRKANSAALAHLKSLSYYQTESFMLLDNATRRNLELTSSQSEDSTDCLLRVLGQTRTPMGARLLKKWLDQPMLSVEDINRRQNAVASLVESVMLRADLRDSLSGIQDIERLVSRASSGMASPRDLIGLASSLEQAKLLAPMLTDSAEHVQSLGQQSQPPSEIIDLITTAIDPDPPAHTRDGGMIRSGYNSELDELRDAARGGKQWIAQIESRERVRTGIKSLKVGHNNVFGYFLEVSKSSLDRVPDDYTRKQTTANTERFITQELKEYESRVLGSQESAVALEQELFSDVRTQVAARSAELLAIARAIAELDATQSLAEVAHTNRWTAPLVDDSDVIEIHAGRHPVVERALGPGAFVPNDSLLNCTSDCLLIITGPNMAGKSTYLRQVAIIVLLAQIGSFVPADRARIGVVDRIFTRIGARDELSRGQSTFMVEMSEAANILNCATSRSLILLDEIGRGTSTYDGLSIAWAIAEHILTIRAKSLFATHYHHLNELASQAEGVKNYRIAVKEEPDRIIWLRKIMPGGTDKSYGIQVARLAGLPDPVIARAEQILTDLERDTKNTSVSPSGAPAAVATEQLTLFEAAAPEVVTKLKSVDVGTLTPVEALTTLWQLQKDALEQFPN